MTMKSSLTSCFMLAFIASIFMITAVSSNDSSSQSEIFQSTYPKNDDYILDKRPAFYVGSRYGRSPQSYGTKARRLSVAPRADRFFLGSRYGKRANEYTMPIMYDDLTAHQQIQQSQSFPSSITYSPVRSSVSPGMEDGVLQRNQLLFSELYKLSCTYTGYKNYYKCNNLDDIDKSIKQLTGENASLI